MFLNPDHAVYCFPCFPLQAEKNHQGTPICWHPEGLGLAPPGHVAMLVLTCSNPWPCVALVCASDGVNPEKSIGIGWNCSSDVVCLYDSICVLIHESVALNIPPRHPKTPKQLDFMCDRRE